MRSMLVAGTGALIVSAIALAQPEPNATRIERLFNMSADQFDKALAARFQYPPPRPVPPIVADERAGQALDAAYFERFPDYDRSYSPRARLKAKELAADLKRHAANLNHEQFVLRVAEIAALADNAHTAISEDAIRKGTARIPIRTFLFSDGLHVLRAAPAHADLLGARIDSIAGENIDSLYARLTRYLGGLEARRRLRLLPILESPGLLSAAGVATPPDRLLIRGTLADGTTFERTIAAEQRDRSAMVVNTIRLLFPSRNEPMAGFLSPGPALPVYLRSSDKLFAIHDLPGRGLYLGMSHNTDGDEERIAPFLDRSLARVKSAAPRYLVVDMRMNGGGDYTTTYDFARALPTAAGKGPIYVLTSPWTFSAAITTVAALQDAGGARVRIVGEPVGDRLEFWAEGGSFDLPNSGIRVSYAAGRHNYAGPCGDRRACFWLNELYPVRVDTLAPHIHARWTFADYRANRDPAMEAIFALEVTKGERG